MGNGPCDGLIFCVSDCILLEIFQYLNHRDLISVSAVCTNWWRVSHDESLWKRRFLVDFDLPFQTELSASNNANRSWYSEYIRFVDKIPLVESEVLTVHVDEVLHVAFSNNGSLFSTCSKDCTVKIWSSNYPCHLLYNETSLKDKLRWKYTQFSQFNVDDSLLLVSGVHNGEHSTSGEIAVFEVGQDRLIYRCRVLNKPYDVFGCWFNRDWIVNGELDYLSPHTPLNSRTDICLCKASQELQSARTPVLARLFKFINKNGSTIRMVQTSGYVSNWVIQAIAISEKMESAKKHGEVFDLSAEVDKFHDDIAAASASCSQPSTSQNLSKNGTENRLLIFSMGEATYTPHAIGFKLVKNDLFERLLNEEVMSDERREKVFKKMRELREQERQESLSQTNLSDVSSAVQPPQLANPDIDNHVLDWEFLKANFDFPDHVIDLHGHVIGIALSVCERYLFINVRPWPEGSLISDPWEPPPIAQQIELRVVDLEKLILLNDVVYRGHKGYTPNDECFFIFLDSSDTLVASGSEDKHAYIWDRHYQKLIGQLSHEKVVNAVAFNKKDEEMLVTVSDDHQIKVWRSKNAIRTLKGQ